MPIQRYSQRESIELYFAKEYTHQAKNGSRDKFFLDAVQFLREGLTSRIASKGRVFLCQVDDCITTVKQGLGYRRAEIDSIEVTSFMETDNRPVQNEMGTAYSHYSMWMRVVYDESYEERLNPFEFNYRSYRPNTLCSQMEKLSLAVEQYRSRNLDEHAKSDDDWKISGESGHLPVPYLHSFPHLTALGVYIDDRVRNMISDEYEKMKEDNDTSQENLESSQGWDVSISDCASQKTEVDDSW